ncbi:ABC transporter ATP-binding protein [Dongia deserti]|uniref:ABC transporter ATP-binding protein n=1 Tax=Dongia deserti TaxID=2268030 RepID=UPI000E64B044|nr:ABC transporter ATP-binding protein [Dongia deserti]
MTGLLLNGVTRDFTEPAARHVLRSIDLTIAKSEFVSLVGPSGAGKTTLLRIIAGLDIAHAGRVTWQGEGRPRLGIVFQEPRLVPWLSILDNLLLVGGSDQAERARALLAEVELAGNEDALPSQLSGGMQRRAALARALLIAPDFLMLDEPLISLDTALAERMRRLLNSYWREHRTTTLLVTHNLAEAAELSTRILILSPDEGRIVADCALPPPAPRLRNDRAVSAVLEDLRRMTHTWPRPDSPETGVPKAHSAA